jgi:Ser/Thr protein kinase RdoA (MazF antagonist)
LVSDIVASVTPFIARGLPRARIVACQPLTGGLINSNFKVQLDSPSCVVVLRIYERDPESCQKEIDLLRFVSKTVPVPEVLYAAPRRSDETRPFVILRYVEGITFRELKQTGDTTAIQQASHSIGRTLAAIGRYKFPESGRLGPGLVVSGKFVEGRDPVPRLVERFLSSSVLQSRISVRLRQQLHELFWTWLPRLTGLDAESSLVHGDFGSRNTLVRLVGGKWTVAGVIDWEFALSGATLMDVGHFLRYDRDEQPVREPHFSRGYLEGGGKLSDDWRMMARVMDLTALVELMTRDGLPGHLMAEIRDLIQAALDKV